MTDPYTAYVRIDVDLTKEEVGINIDMGGVDSKTDVLAILEMAKRTLETGAADMFFDTEGRIGGTPKRLSEEDARTVLGIDE